jgi:acyl-CoA synthetase (AMP-forming)/AMP-acid ligase II
MSAYYGARPASAASGAEWLDTGDLGYVRDNRLFVTGRDKELVILRGRKFSPSEFEWAAGDVPGVRKGHVAAFGVYSEEKGTECLVIVCETDLKSEKDRDNLREVVSGRVMGRTGIAPDVVHLIGRGRLPWTTSGKLQRSKAKAAFLDDKPSRAWRP